MFEQNYQNFSKVCGNGLLHFNWRVTHHLGDRSANSATVDPVVRRPSFQQQRRQVDHRVRSHSGIADPEAADRSRNVNRKEISQLRILRFWKVFEEFGVIETVALQHVCHFVHLVVFEGVENFDRRGFGSVASNVAVVVDVKGEADDDIGADEFSENFLEISERTLHHEVGQVSEAVHGRGAVSRLPWAVEKRENFSDDFRQVCDNNFIRKRFEDFCESVDGVEVDVVLEPVADEGHEAAQDRRSVFREMGAVFDGLKSVRSKTLKSNKINNLIELRISGILDLIVL